MTIEPVSKARCAYCRRPVRKARCRCKGECRGHGIYFTCTHHKNRPVEVRFSGVPIVISSIQEA